MLAGVFSAGVCAGALAQACPRETAPAALGLSLVVPVAGTGLQWQAQARSRFDPALTGCEVPPEEGVDAPAVRLYTWEALAASVGLEAEDGGLAARGEVGLNRVAMDFDAARETVDPETGSLNRDAWRYEGSGLGVLARIDAAVRRGAWAKGAGAVVEVSPTSGRAVEDQTRTGYTEVTYTWSGHATHSREAVLLYAHASRAFGPIRAGPGATGPRPGLPDGVAQAGRPSAPGPAPQGAAELGLRVYRAEARANGAFDAVLQTSSGGAAEPTTTRSTTLRQATRVVGIWGILTWTPVGWLTVELAGGPAWASAELEARSVIQSLSSGGGPRVYERHSAHSLAAAGGGLYVGLRLRPSSRVSYVVEAGRMELPGVAEMAAEDPALPFPWEKRFYAPLLLLPAGSGATLLAADGRLRWGVRVQVHL